MSQPMLTKPVMQMAAIFAGNYLARKTSALSSEQIIKVIAQAVTLESAIGFFRLYVPIGNYQFLQDYIESILMLIAVAGTSVAYDAILQAAEGKAVNINKEDVKLGLYQGLVVAAGNIAQLY